MTPAETAAWELYCEETKHDSHAADFWHELPLRMREVYLAYVAWMPSAESIAVSLDSTVPHST